MSTIEVGHDWSGEQWDWPLNHHDGIANVHNTNDKFEVGLDLQFFKPNEIDVKVSNNEVLINCSHAVREDEHGSVERHIQRAYRLPDDIDVSTLKSHLTSRGVLKITAQKKSA